MATTIVFSCSKCKTKIEVPSSLAGRKGKCKGCGDPLQIPKLRQPAASHAPRPIVDEGPEDLFDEASEEIDATPLPAMPAQVAPRRTAPKRPKAKRASDPDVSLADVVVSSVLGVVGLVCLLSGLFAIEVIIVGFQLGKTGNLSLIGLLIVFAALFGGGVYGVARLLGLVLRRATPQGLRGGVGAITLVMAVIVGAFAIARDQNKPPLILSMLLLAKPNPFKFSTAEAQPKYDIHIAALKSDDPVVRKKAVEELMFLRGFGHQPSRSRIGKLRANLIAIIPITPDNDLSMLLFVIGQFGSEEDVPVLLGLYDDERAWVVRCAKMAVQNIREFRKRDDLPYPEG